MIKVLLIDDHPLVRKGIKSMLLDEPDIQISGETGNGVEALEKIKELEPDVILCDIAMPGLTGIELLRKLEAEQIKTKVLVLSVYDDEEYIAAAILYGACGYLLKDCEKEELITAIRRVHTGKKYFSNTVAEILAKIHQQAIERQMNLNETKVSERECEVLNYTAQGYKSSQIAEKLFISTRTVEAHRYSIMKKLNANNTVELIQKARKLKLISD